MLIRPSMPLVSGFTVILGIGGLQVNLTLISGCALEVLDLGPCITKS